MSIDHAAEHFPLAAEQQLAASVKLVIFLGEVVADALTCTVLCPNFGEALAQPPLEGGVNRLPIR